MFKLFVLLAAFLALAFAAPQTVVVPHAATYTGYGGYIPTAYSAYPGVYPYPG